MRSFPDLAWSPACSYGSKTDSWLINWCMSELVILMILNFRRTHGLSSTHTKPTNGKFHARLLKWFIMARPSQCLLAFCTHRLHASNVRLNLGVVNHHAEPAVFAAATVDQALRYAWPSSALKDNLYYRVVLQCEISPHAVMRRHKGEILVHEGHVFIRKVFMFFNCAIEKGAAKGADHSKVQSLELLPFPPGGSLTVSPLRPTAWFS